MHEKLAIVNEVEELHANTLEIKREGKKKHLVRLVISFSRKAAEF